MSVLPRVQALTASFPHAPGHLSLHAKRETVESTTASNIALEFNHALLIASRISRVRLQTPAQELIGVVGLKVGAQYTQSLAVLGDLGPVALDVLQILGEVGVAALKDLPVKLRVHGGLEVDIFLPSLVGIGEDKVGSLLDGTHKGANLFGVLRNELLIANVENRAEAAASQLSELVDTEHLNLGLLAALARKPLLQLDHLNVLQTDAGVNLFVDDGLGDIHAAADGGVVLRSEAVVRGELIDLDLAELADVSNSLTLERAEVGGDARILEVYHAGEWLVQETADREHGKVTSLGL